MASVLARQGESPAPYIEYVWRVEFRTGAGLWLPVINGFGRPLHITAIDSETARAAVFAFHNNRVKGRTIRLVRES